MSWVGGVSERLDYALVGLTTRELEATRRALAQEVERLGFQRRVGAVEVDRADAIAAWRKVAYYAEQRAGR